MNFSTTKVKLKSLSVMSLKDIQKETLRLLIEFDKICNQYHLTYYLAYGTLLGARRNNGYIPWDDDIDVCMPRKDYEILLSLNITFNESVLCYPTRENPSSLWAKLKSNRCIFVDDSSLENDGLGVFIDIFPLDKFPIICSKSYFLLIKLIRGFRNSAYGINFNNDASWLNYRIARRLISNAAKQISKVRYFNIISLLTKRFEYSQTNHLGNYFYNGPASKAVFQSEIFGEGRMVEFEGYYFNAPSLIDEYLSTVYGDNWRTPIQRERLSHGIAYWQ